MAVEAPVGLPIKWFPINQTGARSWGTLKAKLTGKKSDFGHYFSEVNLSDSDADRLIENIKKDPSGYPYLDDSSGQYEEQYQKWLVKTYLNGNGVGEPEGQGSPTPPISTTIVTGTKKSTDLVEEEIDERILSILQLEDVFDLTYEEYQTLLKEKAVQARMSGSGMSTEDAELITNEYKRVKGKSGSFKVKSKISIDKVMNRRAPSPQKVQLDPKKLLPATQEDQKTEVSNKIVKFLNEDLTKNLEEINNKLVNIVKVLTDQDKLERKEKEKKRRKTEVDKKTKREAELEGSAKRANKVFQTVAKPFVSFFDRIKQFFMSILVGSALNFLLAVFKNPGIILNPLKNLANSIIGFLNNIISFLWNFFVSPINFVITSINNGIRGLIGQINNALNLIPGAKSIASPQIPTIPGPPQIPTPFPVQQQSGGGQVVNYIQQQSGGGQVFNYNRQQNGGRVVNYIQQQNGGGQVVNNIQQQNGGGQVVNVGDISFEGGGQIKKDSGIKISGFGKDDRLIAAQSGEIMMSNAAGDFWGRNNLLAMNAMAGGTNKPKFGKMGVTAMQGGGRVGTLFPHMDAQTATYSGGAHVIGQGQFANLLSSILSQSAQKNKIKKLPGSGSTAVNRDLKSLRVATSSGSPSALAEFSTLKQAVDQYKTPSGFANSSYMSDFIRGLKSALNGDPLVIGMDHSRRMIPNSSSDLRTTQAAAAGASYGGYSERDFTDAIAQRIKKEISNAKIIKPEDYKNYEQYDKALKDAINKAKFGAKVPPAPILPPPAKGGIVPLPIPVGGGTPRSSVPTSTAAPNQASVPSFSSEDPNNMTTLVVKAIYNVVG